MKKILLLLFSFVLSLPVFAKNMHPYHVSSVEINYNEKTKTFEISARIFLDDLENALTSKYQESLAFQNSQTEEKVNKALEKYFSEYFKLKVNNKFLKVNYLGFEEDKEAVDIFLESEPVENPKKVETAVSLLYNIFDDQINIVHIIVNKQRKSSKLNYPDRYLYQIF